MARTEKKIAEQKVIVASVVLKVMKWNWQWKTQKTN